MYADMAPKRGGLPRRRHRRVSAFDVIILTFLLLFCLTCIYPFIYIIAISLNDASDAARGGIYLWPRVFTLANYRAIFADGSILQAYGITVARVVVSALTQLFCNATFAYSLSKKEFQGRKFCNWMILIPMYFGGGIIPYYIILQATGLLNSFFTYIVPALYSSFNIMIMRTSIKEIPDALSESAYIDGASDLTIFFRIVLPLIKPTLATIALFVSVGAWNDWFTGFTYITNDGLWCIQNVLLRLLQSNEASNIAQIARFRQGIKVQVTAESIKMAMLVVTTLPVLCVYPFLQKYFVKGVLIGSLKE